MRQSLHKTMRGGRNKASHIDRYKEESNWNRYKDAIEQSKSDYDPDEVEACLRAIEREIEKLQ